MPFGGSSSSCPCCIEGFFLELLLRMPTLSQGVQWSAYLSGLCHATSFLPLYLGVFLGYHRIDPLHLCSSLLEFSFGCILQVLLPSHPGFDFSRRQYTLFFFDCLHHQPF